MGFPVREDWVAGGSILAGASWPLVEVMESNVSARPVASENRIVRLLLSALVSRNPIEFLGKVVESLSPFRAVMDAGINVVEMRDVVLLKVCICAAARSPDRKSTRLNSSH